MEEFGSISFISGKQRGGKSHLQEEDSQFLSLDGSMASFLADLKKDLELDCVPASTSSESNPSKTEPNLDCLSGPSQQQPRLSSLISAERMNHQPGHAEKAKKTGETHSHVHRPMNFHNSLSTHSSPQTLPTSSVIQKPAQSSSEIRSDLRHFNDRQNKAQTSTSSLPKGGLEHQTFNTQKCYSVNRSPQQLNMSDQIKTTLSSSKVKQLQNSLLPKDPFSSLGNIGTSLSLSHKAEKDFANDSINDTKKTTLMDKVPTYESNTFLTPEQDIYSDRLGSWLDLHLGLKKTPAPSDSAFLNNIAQDLRTGQRMVSRILGEDTVHYNDKLLHPTTAPWKPVNFSIAQPSKGKKSDEQKATPSKRKNENNRNSISDTVLIQSTPVEGLDRSSLKLNLFTEDKENLLRQQMKEGPEEFAASNGGKRARTMRMQNKQQGMPHMAVDQAQGMPKSPLCLSQNREIRSLEPTFYSSPLQEDPGMCNFQQRLRSCFRDISNSALDEDSFASMSQYQTHSSKPNLADPWWEIEQRFMVRPEVDKMVYTCPDSPLIKDSESAVLGIKGVHKQLPMQNVQKRNILATKPDRNDSGGPNLIDHATELYLLKLVWKAFHTWRHFSCKKLMLRTFLRAWAMFTRYSCGARLIGPLLHKKILSLGFQQVRAVTWYCKATEKMRCIALKSPWEQWHVAILLWNLEGAMGLLTKALKRCCLKKWFQAVYLPTTFQHWKEVTIRSAKLRKAFEAVFKKHTVRVRATVLMKWRERQNICHLAHLAAAAWDLMCVRRAMRTWAMESRDQTLDRMAELFSEKRMLRGSFEIFFQHWLVNSRIRACRRKWQRKRWNVLFSRWKSWGTSLVLLRVNGAKGRSFEASFQSRKYFACFQRNCKSLIRQRSDFEKSTYYFRQRSLGVCLDHLFRYFQHNLKARGNKEKSDRFLTQRSLKKALRRMLLNVYREKRKRYAKTVTENFQVCRPLKKAFHLLLRHSTKSLHLKACCAISKSHWSQQQPKLSLRRWRRETQFHKQGPAALELSVMGFHLMQAQRRFLYRLLLSRAATFDAINAERYCASARKAKFLFKLHRWHQKSICSRALNEKATTFWYQRRFSLSNLATNCKRNQRFTLAMERSTKHFSCTSLVKWKLQTQNIVQKNVTFEKAVTFSRISVMDRFLRNLLLEARLRRFEKSNSVKLLATMFQSWLKVAKNQLIGGSVRKQLMLAAKQAGFRRFRSCLRKKKNTGTLFSYGCQFWSKKCMSSAFSWLVNWASRRFELRRKKRAAIFRWSMKRLFSTLQKVQMQKVLVWRANVFYQHQRIAFALLTWKRLTQQKVSLNARLHLFSLRKKRNAALSNSKRILGDVVVEQIFAAEAVQQRKKELFEAWYSLVDDVKKVQNAVCTFWVANVRMHVLHRFLIWKKALLAYNQKIFSVKQIHYAVMLQLRDFPVNDFRAKEFFNRHLKRKAFRTLKIIQQHHKRITQLQHGFMDDLMLKNRMLVSDHSLNEEDRIAIKPVYQHRWNTKKGNFESDRSRNKIEKEDSITLIKKRGVSMIDDKRIEGKQRPQSYLLMHLKSKNKNKKF